MTLGKIERLTSLSKSVLLGYTYQKDILILIFLFRMKYSYPSLFKIHPTAKTFLDLGCGQGFIPLYAAARGLQVDAVDIETETPASLQEVPAVLLTLKIGSLPRSMISLSLIIASNFYPKSMLFKSSFLRSVKR